MSPLQLNIYCNNNSETVLHVAVRGKHYEVASALLLCGTDPNLPCRLPDQVKYFAMFVVLIGCLSSIIHAVFLMIAGSISRYGRSGYSLWINSSC